MKFIPKPITSTVVNTNDHFGRGMDLALVTLVFLGLGYGLDRWLNTKPVFMIGFVLLALVGQFVSMWYRYEASMSTHDAERAAGRTAGQHRHRVSAGEEGAP